MRTRGTEDKGWLRRERDEEWYQSCGVYHSTVY